MTTATAVTSIAAGVDTTATTAVTQSTFRTKGIVRQRASDAKAHQPRLSHLYSEVRAPARHSNGEERRLPPLTKPTFVSQLPTGSRSEALVKVEAALQLHSATFPRISNSPQRFAFFAPTGCRKSPALCRNHDQRDNCSETLEAESNGNEEGEPPGKGAVVPALAANSHSALVGRRKPRQL